MEIEAGKKYLLDGETEVIVLKAINRSQTSFSIEIPGKSVESVQKDRLKPIQGKINSPD